MVGLFFDQNLEHLRSTARSTEMARPWRGEVVVVGRLDPLGDRSPAVPPVPTCAARIAGDDQVSEVAAGGTERVFPVDPVAVREMYEAPGDRGHRRRFGWRPVVVDRRGAGAVRRWPHGPDIGDGSPEALVIRHAVEPLVEPIRGRTPLIGQDVAHGAHGWTLAASGQGRHRAAQMARDARLAVSGQGAAPRAAGEAGW